jgi:hypothetical protein
VRWAARNRQCLVGRSNHGLPVIRPDGYRAAERHGMARGRSMGRDCSQARFNASCLGAELHGGHSLALERGVRQSLGTGRTEGRRLAVNRQLAEGVEREPLQLGREHGHLLDHLIDLSDRNVPHGAFERVGVPGH